jgi:glycosyl transferase family 25
MQIYVVTLDHATKRQLNIKRQFGAAGLAFTFFYGVDGNKGHHPLFDLYNESKRLGVKGEPLSLGQLGCFASHYQLW